MSAGLKDQLIMAVAVLGIGGTISGLLYSIHKIATKIEKVLGTDKDNRTIMDRMTRVEYQLWPNGGESLADKVRATADSNAAMADSVNFIKDVMLQIVVASPGEEVEQVAVKHVRKKRSTF